MSFVKLFKRLFKMKKDKTYYTRDESKVKEVEHLSPSGVYRIVISSHRTGESTWNYTKARIYEVGTQCGPIAVVRRNYSSFPFLFVEDHPNGHDYLVCGEDYQGQTIIELDTNERKDYFPQKGWGFCWASYKHSTSKRTLAVNGCYWGGPYEVWLIDFDDPMNGLPVLYQARDCDEFVGWHEDKPDTCEIGESYEFCTPLNKREGELTDEEWEKVEELESELSEEIWRTEANVVTTWTREDKDGSQDQAAT